MSETKPAEPLADNEYRCARCGGVFEKGWSDEEATAESLALWGRGPGPDMAVVCEDCFTSGRWLFR